MTRFRLSAARRPMRSASQPPKNRPSRPPITVAVLIAVSSALPMPKLALMLLPIAPTEFCSRVSKNMPARISIITQNWARVKPARSSVADIVVVVAFELLARVMGTAPDRRGVWNRMISDASASTQCLYTKIARNFGCRATVTAP